ncbi:unnamed protein product [Eruca vesicaria subsp. sativa]|uniref:Translation elongation factor EF1B beta/delta subunit guanine nucleotide exchange domain-containing protein n=1 Tax=Eruca vesicaria subsp. sativa TaxID=29727 RepID=A0ABC8LHM6_ERUVS|nr:unnamed protein product [Eruca vesicaria subsp. sativa]
MDDVKVFATVVEKPNDAFPNASKCCFFFVDCEHAPPADDDNDMDLFGDETEEERNLQRRGRLLRRTPRSPKSVSLFVLRVICDHKSGKSKGCSFVLFDSKEAVATALASMNYQSSVLMEVKPWNDETEMKKLETAVRSVEMPGFYGELQNWYQMVTVSRSSRS